MFTWPHLNTQGLGEFLIMSQQGRSQKKLMTEAMSMEDL